MDNHLYRKLKPQKLQRIKSRYKTQVATKPNQQQEESYNACQSKQFANVYNRLSNHYHVNFVHRRFSGEKYKNKSKQDSNNRLNKSYNSSSYKIKPLHAKSNSQSHAQVSNVGTPQKQTKKPNSLNKFFLPSVKGIPNYPLNSRSSKSLKSIQAGRTPMLNKSFSLFQGLMLHVHNIATIYNRLRRNSNVQNIMQAIQQYIFEQNKADVSKLDLLFVSEEVKIQCRLFTFLERIIVVLLVQSQVKKLKTQKTTLKMLLHTICDHYITLLSYLHAEDYNVDKSYILKIMNLIGIQKDSFKPKKIFSENQDIILKINNSLKGNHFFRVYFHQKLAKIPIMGINQLFYTVLEFYSLALAQHFTICPQIAKFLSTCPSPYLHVSSTKEYTLIMDLDQTLIHYNQNKGTLLVRPHCKKFLNQLSQYFQIGIFTCAMPDYANWVLNQLKCPISFRLYRYHTVQAPGAFLKDISRVGRDIKKMIIVDNMPQNFQLTPKNGVHIKGWTGQCEDRQLLILMQKLLTLIKLSPVDIRQCLQEIIK